MDLLTHLASFVAVAEARSFTRGAETIATPQPVVSRRVAALERHLGGPLLTRSSRRVELSDLGRLLLPHAADLLARADHLREAARAHGGSSAIAVPADVSPAALVAAGRAAATARLDVRFVPLTPRDRDDALGTGEVDAALVPAPPDAAPWRVILGAATTGERLIGRRVHLDQLRPTRAEPRPPRLHLEVDDDVPWIRDDLRRSAREAGLTDEQVVLGSGGTQAAAAAIEHGDVVVCTPSSAARLGLRWRPLGTPLVRSYALTASRHAPRDLPDLTPVLTALLTDDRPDDRSHDHADGRSGGRP